jgi:hypothetical protein
MAETPKTFFTVLTVVFRSTASDRVDSIVKSKIFELLKIHSLPKFIGTTIEEMEKEVDDEQIGTTTGSWEVFSVSHSILPTELHT